jgi:CHAD domain-containing protein
MAPELSAATLTWHKSQPVILAANATVDQSIAVIVTACRDHWDANMAAAVTGLHPEGVHQFRVGLRRFRTALTLFKDYLPASQRTWLKTEAKALSDLLGPARDLDVFLTELAVPVSGTAASDPQVAAMLRTAREARGAAHTRLADALTNKRYRRFMTRLNTWLEGRGWRHGQRIADDGETSALRFARATLNRRLAKIQKRAKTIDSAPTAALHELRIEIKKVRYGFEFFQALLPQRRVQRLGRLLKALQDSLGHLNDIDVAGRTLQALQDQARDTETRTAVSRVGTRLAATFKPLAKNALPEAARVAARLRDQKPL